MSYGGGFQWCPRDLIDCFLPAPLRLFKASLRRPLLRAVMWRCLDHTDDIMRKLLTLSSSVSAINVQSFLVHAFAGHQDADMNILKLFSAKEGHVGAPGNMA